MIWFAAILGILVGVVFGVIKKDLTQGLRVGSITFGIGAAFALILIYSGFMGG